MLDMMFSSKSLQRIVEKAITRKLVAVKYHGVL